MLDDGMVRINVDEKYPQAIGISSGIEARVAIFGNALWDVMFADPAYGGFFTSDFPVYDNRVVSKTVPVASDVAIRIHPQLRERGKEPDLSFPGFRARFRTLRPQEMREVNRELVRAAESVVLYHADTDWLLPFVRKHRAFRVESIVTRIPSPLGGKMIVATLRILPRARPSPA